MIEAIAILVSVFLAIWTWILFRSLRGWRSLAQRQTPPTPAAEEYLSWELARILRTLEQTYRMKLTHGARTMLVTPLYERQSFRGDVAITEVESSLSELFVSLNAQPPDLLSDSRETRTSLSVLQAFSSCLCRIPPFCGGDGQS